MASTDNIDHSKTYELPPLPYPYDALEPAISAKIMETHHQKHHQTYVNNLNAALQQYREAQAKGDIAKLLSLTPTIRFNGGGHYNHSIFWTNLAPTSKGGGVAPDASSTLGKQIIKDFGSFDTLKTTLTAVSVGVQGSGWGWLGWSSNLKRLEVVARANQDPLTELTPLLGIDVWEHAYYYLYGPARAEYLKQIWTVINWKDVQERFDAASK